MYLTFWQIWSPIFHVCWDEHDQWSCWNQCWPVFQCPSVRIICSTRRIRSFFKRSFAIELHSSETINLPEGLVITLYVKRSVAVKVLAVLIVCTNCKSLLACSDDFWTITLGTITIAFIYIAAACLVWEDERIVTQLFALPVAALFAFTSVRSTLPGAPTGLGIYEKEHTAQSANMP